MKMASMTPTHLMGPQPTSSQRSTMRLWLWSPLSVPLLRRL
uniref:Truncated capsid protein n=1 Tax=Norovirus Hu/GII.4/Tianjin/75/2008/CHN TaxID=666898 RepID=C8CBA2_NORV|nr:truncated capsid protein [Norovirus Hu/GII.4/Tianjin/75/2008/CHN]